MTRHRKSLAAAVFAFSAILVPGAALACNPLEALFGACRMDVFRPPYVPQDVGPRWRPARPPVKHARPAHKVAARTPNADGISGKQTPLKPTAEAPEGSLALFRHDPTLRDGDIVVTNDGFKIYRRGGFAAIAHDGGRLAQLEQVSMKGRAHARPVRRQSVADRRR